MKLQISEVTVPGEAIAFHGSIDTTEWQAEPEGEALLDAPQIDGHYRRDGRYVYVDGELHVHGRTTCTRCLDDAECRQTLPFSEVYVKTATAAETDFDALPFDGSYIDLDALARDIVIMAAGAQVLCRDDCRGLCPGCGVNLNHESCQCVPEEVPPQWAALRELLTTKQ